VTVDLAATPGGNSGDGAIDTVVMNGGAGNDTFSVSATAGSVVIGGLGTQTTVLNAEATDVISILGNGGTDTTQVNGADTADMFAIAANGTAVRVSRTNSATFDVDVTTENLSINGGGGNDMFSASGNIAALISVTVDGGAGDDTIFGSNGADRLLGGDGNDFIDGNQGNDVVLLGAGDDVFQWDPGDGSDTVDGQAGNDTMLFNGANNSEKIDITANHGHVRFTRDVGNITMDLNGVEQIQFTARGDADTINVGDLSGTGVKQVGLDLAGVPGSNVGDSATDSVTVNGTAGNDIVQVSGQGGSVSVAGLPVAVTLAGSETGDQLVIQTVGGNDTINAAGLAAGNVHLTIDGGAGNDTIIGSQGDDRLIGGEGNDVVNGGRGNDVALLGNGNDSFIWNPGDGSDVVEDQGGTDTLVFNGANVAENFVIFANGQRAGLFRDVGNIAMDIKGVELIQFAALGGADTVTVEDLTGTDVRQVAVDLSGTPGSGQGDGQTDTVNVFGTAGDDRITIATSGTSAFVNGLAAQVKIDGADGTDRLVVNGGGGNDVIIAGALHAGQVSLTIFGGDGDDSIVGSAGNDTVNGGRGNDVASLGAGDDTFVWNPGDGSDTVDGGAGNDTLLFNGANINETIDITANHGHVRFTRDIASITMDLNGVEQIQFTARAGADTINVGDLSGTGVTQVAIDLESTPGSGVGDGAPDTIVINATNRNDVINITEVNGVITVSGLAEDVTITGFEAGDQIVINGLGGDDVINGFGLGAGVRLTVNGGDGHDILLGGAGNDILSGGAGDDILFGGGGQDVLDGGPGNNIVIQSLVSNVAASGGSPAPAAALLSQFMASSFVPTGEGFEHMPVGSSSPDQHPMLTPPHA
jgi:Ca2+-binding RTX toxin-like protein